MIEPLSERDCQVTDLVAQKVNEVIALLNRITDGGLVVDLPTPDDHFVVERWPVRLVDKEQSP